MIKAKEGKVSVEGTPIELLADLAVVVRAVKDTLMEEETEESVKQKIDEAVKIGLMNEEEFETVRKEKIKEVVKTLFDDLFGGLFDEDK